MPRAVFFIVLALTQIGTFGLWAQDEAVRFQVETELKLERKLLALDLVAYKESRAREQRARDQLAAVVTRLDQALAGDSLALGVLESLRDELAATREGVRIAGERVDEEVRRLQDRLRRIGFLEAELGARGAARDLLSGRWRVRIEPPGTDGTFELRLAGTVVTGTYQLSDGASGSLTGSLVNGKLRLERVDSQHGFDSVFEGSLAGNALSGTWTATELAAGEATRGQWTATRQ
jgi:hypothetical protein